MGVVGPNGAGKSTLFNVITALLPATSGRVLIHGRPMTESRGVVAYVPQYERVNSRIPASAWDVVMQGRVRHAGWFRRPGRADRDAAEAALNRVGMWDRRKSLIYELSGGQRQRIFVARALAQGADILLLDEAFSGVDIASQTALMDVLLELRDDGRTIMMSSHDINHMAHYCDECLCLNCNVCACGPPGEVLNEDVMTSSTGPSGRHWSGPFQYGFMVRALIVAIVVGVMCPVAGVYVVTRGLGFMSDGLAHSVLPGIVAASILGVAAASVFAGGIPMAIIMALLSGYLIKRAGVGEDASVGILFAALFAIGVIMISIASSQGVSVQVRLEDMLLGNVLGVPRVEMYVTLGVAGAVMLTLFGLHKELVFSNFDPTGASVVGLPTEKLEYILLALLAMVVVVALQAVGIILVISMLITPAAAALQLTRSFTGRHDRSSPHRSCVRRGGTVSFLPLQPAVRTGDGTGRLQFLRSVYKLETEGGRHPATPEGLTCMT
ncbi:Manganese transport system ATP-binding protein MntB [Geodia barretti]|uniref:Manganese transport system ATP-binding protein MntB n=1 Tax=Geodia barretti TaxID=519541 RepID=A0AA35X877_GEOBA|nr:Manganese transport system ATP-binding protein MntB [Geodia barretti]